MKTFGLVLVAGLMAMTMIAGVTCVWGTAMAITQPYGEDMARSGEEIQALIAVSALASIAVIIFLMIPSIVCAVAARRKGLSGFWFLIFSMLFTPLLGFMAVIAFPCEKCHASRHIEEVEAEEIDLTDEDIDWPGEITLKKKEGDLPDGVVEADWEDMEKSYEKKEDKFKL